MQSISESNLVGGYQAFFLGLYSGSVSGITVYLLYFLITR